MNKIDWEQLKQMNEDRKELVNKLDRITDKSSFAYEELCCTIRAHDNAVSFLGGFDIDNLVERINKHHASKSR